MTTTDDFHERLEGLARDIEIVAELVGYYAGNDQFDAWQRVRAKAETGAMHDAVRALTPIQQGGQSHGPVNA